MFLLFPRGIFRFHVSFPGCVREKKILKQTPRTMPERENVTLGFKRCFFFLTKLEALWLGTFESLRWSLGYCTSTENTMATFYFGGWPGFAPRPQPEELVHEVGWGWGGVTLTIWMVRQLLKKHLPGWLMSGILQLLPLFYWDSDGLLILLLNHQQKKRDGISVFS